MPECGTGLTIRMVFDGFDPKSWAPETITLDIEGTDHYYRRTRASSPLPAERLLAACRTVAPLLRGFDESPIDQSAIDALNTAADFIDQLIAECDQT